VDSRQRIDLKELAGAIAADRAAGFTPFLVVGTAGTVDTGAIDDLAGIAELCAHEQLWFHVDGAFGALAMLASELRPRLKGIEQADSLAFDFHKWAQVPYDAGFILVRDGVRHRQAFASSCAYLVREERGLSAGSPWPCDFGLDLSRGFRALKTWATLKVYGTDAIGAVISRTCELARYLESRIAAAPELELMASVELNIVCFRYRFRSPADSATDEFSDQLNRQIVIELQESGAVAPSTTTIGNRLAIRAAIVNHRTSRAEIDTLVEKTLAAGRALRPTVSSAERSESKWQPWLERDAMVRQLDALLDRHEKARTDRLKVLHHERSRQLNLNGLGRLLVATVQRKADDMQKEVEVALRVRRATLLAQMGRSLEAKTDHLKVLELEPSHRLNLIGLGRLLLAAGQRKASQVIYAEAVKHHPEDIVSRVNLGGALLEGDDPAGALAQFEIALQIDPEFPQAQRGMYYALIRLGKPEAAELHRRKAFGQKNLFPALYRGDSQPIPVVLLVSSTGGNTPIEKLLDDRVFQTYVVIADFYDAKAPLPPHKLVVNGIGDPDAAAQALVAADSLLALTSTPVLNAPAAVRATGRCENARRLGNLPGILAPATAMFPHALLGGPNGPASVARRGFTFPLLLRAPGFHMGKHFVRVESPAELAAAVAELPGARRRGAELLAMEYLDARGTDGCARKYRVMMVDGRLYPLHLAISQNWKIHYFSADMADRPEHRDEEARFLSDMPGVLGSKAVAALERVQAVLGLDYGGIDFGLNQRGEILLFEANATMVVMPPDADKRWDYRRAAVERIHAAVHQMLMTSAVGIQSFGDRECAPAPTFCEPREMNRASL
jgi:tetratricopeptide (TPR) repeat protein